MAEPRRDRERPSPEALLEAARREDGRTGKLKIFVGAAPGVGKTYEMLQQARARKRDGYDIIVGVVETHGRKETQALLEGFEVVPRKRLEYRGQSFDEMDLDAIIARHPQIVLVDELVQRTHALKILAEANTGEPASALSTRRIPRSRVPRSAELGTTRAPGGSNPARARRADARSDAAS